MHTKTDLLTSINLATCAQSASAVTHTGLITAENACIESDATSMTAIESLLTSDAFIYRKDIQAQ
jgi:hypothetical protein